jgi:malate dehydrogenase (oxaloacetate-decarboxylating)
LDTTDVKEAIAKVTNPLKKTGDLSGVLAGSDVFIGVSAANALTKEMIKAMNRDPIIFAMANPDPEIHPEEAKAVVETGVAQILIRSEETILTR